MVSVDSFSLSLVQMLAPAIVMHDVEASSLGYVALRFYNSFVHIYTYMYIDNTIYSCGK